MFSKGYSNLIKELLLLFGACCWGCFSCFGFFSVFFAGSVTAAGCGVGADAGAGTLVMFPKGS